jgi:hypothetical protein
MPNIQLTITLTEAGQLNVEGDVIQNKMMAYGLLEVAKEAIKNMHDQAAHKVQAPTAAERFAILQGGK